MRQASSDPIKRLANLIHERYQPELGERLGKDIQPTRLREILSEYYNISELEDLCLRLGIDDQELAKETIGQFARAIISYCKHRGRLSELATQTFWHRPNAPW